MKTIKHLFYFAASLILLVNTSSNVYAAGNDWFGDKYRFYAYYDGMGSMNFSLLVWTEGASLNHYAFNEPAEKYKADTYHTYVEYSIDGKKSDDKTKTWTKLFYYEGDNVQNKKEKGMALFWAADPKKDYLFFTIPEDTELEKPLKGTESAKDTVLISHARDERRSVSLNLRWAVPTDMDEKKISIRLHVYDRTNMGTIWTEHTFVLLDNVLMEPGNPAPELLMSSIFMGGTDPKDAGKIMVSYVFYDQPIEYTIFYNDSQHGSKQSITEPVGSFDIPATDSVKKNLYISARVKRLNDVDVSVQSNSVDIPAYHMIRDFTVTAMMDTLKGENNAKIPMNSGYKLLKWSIRNPSAEDAALMDYYEIQRAYKSDFSDAEQIGTVLFSSHKDGKYEYIDKTSINNPNGGNSIYYRIRRMSASSYGWTGHPYAASYTYVGRVKQIGLNLYDERHKYTPYAAFRDCATDSEVNNNKIDLSGQLIWPIGDSTATTAWDPNTKIEVVLLEDGSEAFVKTIDKLYTKVYGTRVIIEFEYEAQLPKTCQEYDLSVRLNTDATRFDKPQTTKVWFYPKLRTKAVNMTKVTASDSDESHPEHTLIKWEADGEPTYFTVWRSNEQGKFDSIAICDSQTKSYNDPEGKPGQEYTYKVKAVTLCSGDNMETEATDLGTRSRYGYIDGNITYTNGDKMANIQVCLIKEKTTIDVVKTDIDGSYKFSHIEYDLGDNGSKYEISISSMGQSFYPAKGGTVPATVTLTSDSPVAHNINFLSDSYQRCSGRVLYTGTTIPVRDAYFLINGQVAKSSGDTIRSDASGNFVLSVPSGIDFTLSVAKKKHSFVNDGKLILYGTDTLNVSSGSLDAVRFWDNTRVRLVGRLAGGDIQGLKPLGFGLSKNNLGDSLKLVFELEGDNIAHFVYDENNLSKTTRDTTFVCANGKDTTLRTPVRFEEKRIIVRPDVKTGEYVIDLPPVKYRIVEATANGYATLFGAGRTSETKDLTFSLDTVRVSHENKPVWYHDTYSVIYHALASVVVSQLRFGVPLEHYGEEVVEGYTLDSIRYDSVCTHKSGKWEYTLGYPVYLSDYRYGFRINAREEYHYNNDRNRDLDVVPLGKHKYTVYNGLESGTSIIKGELDSEGRSDVIVNVSNMSFDAIGIDEALKRFEVSVNINGQDVHAQPIKAFVLGNRLTGNNVMQKIGSMVTLNDVLRDPPGSNSSAWIAKGATYSTSYTVSRTMNASLNGSVDVKRKLNQSIGSYLGSAEAGNITGTWLENSSGTNIPIASFTYTGTRSSTYSYSFTTNERITTSPDNTVLGIGAPATVFIGHTVNTYATHAEILNIVDSATLKAMAPAIEQGTARIVTQKGSSGLALIVTQDLAFTMDEVPVQFAYTQNHIASQIIPQLVSELASILYSDSVAAQRKADATDKVAYWIKSDKTIIGIKPQNWDKNRIYTNEAEEYLKLIDQWTKILVNNEYIELYGSNTANRLGSYSLSGGTSFTYTEVGSTSASYSQGNNKTPSTDLAAVLTGALSAWGAGDLTDTYTLIQDYINNQGGDEGHENDNKGTDIEINGAKAWKINILPSISGTWDQNGSNSPSFNREIGFTLSQIGVGYVDVDVYRLNSTVDFNNDSTLTSWRTLAANMPAAKDSMKTGNYDCSDFVYLLRGGATSCPYIGENVTHFYRPGTVLDPATVKLESPRIEVDKHEVSGVAADGVAVFDLQIWNETEVPAGVLDGVHSFNLRLDEPSNPQGAKVTIDGNPLTPSGMDFLLSGRQVIHKKLEVRQGAIALNYDSLELVLMSSCDPLNKCHQYISVHFLPSSTPVHIATPDDKWVMNTNSPYDKQGYYLPVVIDGFDPDYANFDHIELQYKLSTQSESNWVTLCSYYVDEKYYNKASGNKQMFNKEAGRIDNIHFYGERDPMEQRYDLRAVSYCRYGTGYVTKASAPISGIKDTRRPELFGNVAPANGILTQQDYISVPFSEPIAYNYLDEDNNFQVVGFKNKADYFSMPTLAFSGSDSYARTQMARDLCHSDFSIDLIVYPDDDSRNTQMAFFSTGQPPAEKKQAIEFGYNGKQLYAHISENEILSNPIDLPHNFTRVTMTYSAKNGDVCLYVGTQQVGGTKAQITAFNAAPLTFGVGMNNLHPFKGRMAEARIWSKALSLGEITSTNNICLTGYESGLLAYYPMTEGYGTTAYDKAHSANANLNNLTWSMPEGLALRTSGEGVQLNPQWFNNSADADYTLILNFRSDPSKPFSGDALLFGDVNVKMDATNKQIGIFMTQQGQIVLVSDSTNRLVADGNYNDGAWHSLGLVVSHGFNYTRLYIDDKLKAHTNGQFYGAWAMSKTYLGKNFNGYFDELSIWELAMPQSYLNEFATYAPNGQEFGLRCYLPFDQRIKNTSSIYETHYSPYNARLYYNRDKQEWYAKQDTVIISYLDDQSTTKDVCPLIRNSEYEKMYFSWTSRDNDLVINLNMPDAEINHKSIFFSLRDVEDLQGNRLLSPIAWSVYLDRNIIRWAEQNLWVEKSAGTMDTVVYTTITNYSGETKPFVISGLPDWLTVDEPIGMLQPQEERVLAFTISGDLNAGDYVVPIALTDEADLSDQMLINVRVNAVFPNWSIPNSFNLNMNLIGTVHLRDGARGTYVDTDTRDVVGAFYGNTCVGMQSITSKLGSTANLYLKVYGKADMDKKDISLRLWQASTGKTFELINSSDPTIQSEWRIRFVPDTVYGSVQKPIDFYVADSRVQNIPIYTGWNWISFNVQPTDINSSFVNVGGFSSNDQIKVYRDERVASSELDAAVYTQGRWSNNIMLDYRNIYMMNVSSSMVLEVRGLAAGQAPELTFRHGWNNLPCLFDANTPVDAAMADYFNAAKDGDIITGYYQFAVFDNKQWVGSLESLIPGEGYMLYRQAKDEVTVHFYPSVPASAPRKKVESESESESRTYSTAMPIVAALESNEVAINLDNAVLRAYAHDELVGEAKAVDGMWFLLVHAKDNAELTFTVTDDKGEEHSASNVLNYGAFAPTGTVHNPYLIRFGESDLRKVMEHGILYIHRNGNVYDAQGTKL